MFILSLLFNIHWSGGIYVLSSRFPHDLPQKSHDRLCKIPQEILFIFFNTISVVQKIYICFHMEVF